MSKDILKSGNVLKNTSWLIIGNIFRMVIQLIIGAISARYLGPGNYGILNYVIAYTSLFSIICELGLTITIVNELVIKKNEQGKILGTAITLRFIIGIISVIVLQGLVFIVDHGDKAIQIITLIKSIGLLFESFNSFSGWYQYKLQSKYIVIIELISYAISSIFKIYVLITKKNIYWFAASSTIDIICIGIFYMLFYKKHSIEKLGFSILEAKKLLKGGVPFILGGIMIFIYGQTDRIMLKVFIDEINVGYYSCAATISTLIGFIPQAIMNSGKTVIMETKAEKNIKKYRIKVSQIVSIIFWIMSIYSIGVFITGKILIFIMFGKEFYPARQALNILVWSSGFSYIGTIRNIWLICEEKNRYATLFSLLGALLNIVLNYLFIIKMGIVGASLATVITQVCTTALFPSFFSETKEFSKIVMRGIFLKDISISDIKEFREKIKNRR